MKKKILLYTGNHLVTGIIDYVQTLNILAKKLDFILIQSNSIFDLFKRDFYAVFVIEEFSGTKQMCLINIILSKFKGKKILILTEFLNEKNKTFNSFENILKKNKYSLFFKIKNTINFLTRNYLLSLSIYIFLLFIDLIKIGYYKIKIGYYKLKLNKILDLLRYFKFIIFSHIPGFFFRITIITIILFFNPFFNLTKKKGIINSIRIFAIKYRKIKFRVNLKWGNFGIFFYRNASDQLIEEVYMKTRYLGLKNTIDFFDIILTSHNNIVPNKLLNKNISVDRLYFYLINDKIEIDIKRKIRLSFSGYLNKYRLKVLKTLCKEKNDFFDYREIERIIKISNPRFIKKWYIGKNICSIHIKKSKNWLFSSPTRYINSINKNEIPLILDNFEDNESKLLTVKKNILKINNWNEFQEEIKGINKRIDEYKLILENNEQTLKKII